MDVYCCLALSPILHCHLLLTRIPCVVVERRGSKFFLYRLRYVNVSFCCIFVSTTYISHRCAHSILKVCYGEGDLEPFQGGVNLTAEGWENDKVISLREAAILSNPLNEFQSSMCNCKSDCATGKLHVAYSMQVQFYLLQLLATIGRCVCIKNGGQCSSNTERNCSNQPEEDLLLPVENWTSSSITLWRFDNPGKALSRGGSPNCQHLPSSSVMLRIFDLLYLWYSHPCLAVAVACFTWFW